MLPAGGEWDGTSHVRSTPSRWRMPLRPLAGMLSHATANAGMVYQP
jgi:hypothetical protein